jgi:DNA-binding NarL/FixJ family response regulator
MYRVVLVAGHEVHVRQAAQILRREKELDLSPVAVIVGLARELALLAPEELAQAAVVLFLPAMRVNRGFRWDEEGGRRPPLVVYDVAGQVEVLTALRMGVRGYVDFGEPEVLAESVLRVAKGELVVPAETAEDLRLSLRTVMRADPRIQRLRPEEIKRMRLVAGGRTLKQAGRAARKTPSASYHDFARIRDKLEVETTAEALALLVEAGQVGAGEELPPEEEEE